MSEENTLKTQTPENRPSEGADEAAEAGPETAAEKPRMPREIGGPKGPEPTRYGDWEKNGRCTDF